MSIRKRVSQLLLVLSTVLLAASTGSAAAIEEEVAPEVLPAPVLHSATTTGDFIALVWSPVDGDVRSYLIHRDGVPLFRTREMDGTIQLSKSFLGLRGDEEFAVAAEDQDGNPSPLSNGLVPVAPDELPAPELIDGHFEEGVEGQDDTITLTWTESENDELSGDIKYEVFTDGFRVGFRGTSVIDETIVTFVPPACGCQNPGMEEYTVVATDVTLARSLPSNGLVVPRD